MENKIEEREFNRRDTLWPFLKRLFGLAKKNYPKLFWSLVSATALVAVADATFPLIWMYFIDDVITTNLKDLQAATQAGEAFVIEIQHFVPVLIQFVVWTLVMALGVLAFIWCAENLKERLIYDLRKMMFNRLQELSFTFYDKNSTGWLVSRITSDADRVTELISWGFVSVIWGFSMVRSRAAVKSHPKPSFNCDNCSAVCIF